jgi:hypothetical protein
MKLMTLTFAALTLLILSAPAAPAAADKLQQDPAKAAPTNEAYEQSMKERLGKLGAQLDELKKKADARSEQAEAKLKEHLAEAEIKRQEAVRKLEKLRRASKDSWEKFSADMDKAAKEFEQAFERARTAKE